MAGYAENLDHRTFGKNEKESLEKKTAVNDGMKEEKILDITQQQWFWDQAVMSQKQDNGQPRVCECVIR